MLKVFVSVDFVHIIQVWLISTGQLYDCSSASESIRKNLGNYITCIKQELIIIKFKFKFKFFIHIYIHHMKNNTECNINVNSSPQLLQRSNE